MPAISAIRRTVVVALFLTALAIYLAQIIVKEAIEGHIRTSRSWTATVVIGVLALLAAWQAARAWRKARGDQPTPPT